MSLLRNKYLQRIQVDFLTEDEMRAQLLAAWRRLFKTKLTDENPASTKMRIIDLFIVFAQKWLRDYGETILNESFLGTASLYETIYERARELGYTPRQEIAATATLTLTLSRAITQGLILPKGTYRFQTIPTGSANPVTFELVEDQVIIPAGSAAGSQHQVSIIQGTTIPRELVGTSDGESFQEFETDRGYATASGIRVYVDDVEWTQVDNLMVSDPDDTHYEIIRFTEDGHVVIGFGNGDGESSGHGMSPEVDSEIRVTYRVLPGGQSGNVAAGTITRVSPATSLFTVTNIAAASGWTARETIEEIRWNAMRYGRIQEGIITEEDYTIKAEAIDGVGRAYTVQGEFGENTTAVHVLDEDGNTPDQDFCDSVEATLDDLNPGDEFLTVLKGFFQSVNVAATVWILEGYNAATVLAAVQTALQTWFDPTNYDSAGNRTVYPGQFIHPDHIKKVIETVSGVDRSTVTIPTTETIIPSNKLASLGTVTLTQGGGIP